MNEERGSKVRRAAGGDGAAVIVSDFVQHDNSG